MRAGRYQLVQFVTSRAPNVFYVELYMSYLKGGSIGDYIGTTIGVIKGDTSSLDYSSYRAALIRILISISLPRQQDPQ